MYTDSPRISVTPSAARLTSSLRDIGYDFPSAVADIVDNSIAAGARNVNVEIEFDGPDSVVLISDDGRGMSADELDEALRFGTRRSYVDGELGRYGLGLKTASLSQCRNLTVATRRSGNVRERAVRTLDLDLIASIDDWVLVEPPTDPRIEQARAMLAEKPGTVVLWRNLDRVLPEKRPEGGWARRRLELLADRTAEHLGMVFHRFLQGAAGAGLTLAVNGVKVAPWDPFASDEPARLKLARQTFQIVVGDSVGTVTLNRYILPSRDQFTSQAAFDRMSGPQKWNRQQGLYIYRSDRLVQWGGWGGVRGIDEHTKLARASLHFGSDLDAAFNINVAKMRVTIPPQLRQMLDQPVSELCMRADAAYRKTSRLETAARSTGDMAPRERLASGDELGDPPMAVASAARLPEVGLALRSAAMQSGEYAAFKKIMEALRSHAPDAAAALGLG